MDENLISCTYRRIQRIHPFDKRQIINGLGQRIQSECDLTQTTMDK
jgi:hypothetical protein